MVDTPVREVPDALVIRANNFFHAGWIAGVLGLPENDFDEQDMLIRELERESWQLGWKTARESNPIHIGIFIKMSDSTPDHVTRPERVGGEAT